MMTCSRVTLRRTWQSHTGARSPSPLPPPPCHPPCSLLIPVRARYFRRDADPARTALAPPFSPPTSSRAACTTPRTLSWAPRLVCASTTVGAFTVSGDGHVWNLQSIEHPDMLLRKAMFVYNQSRCWRLGSPIAPPFSRPVAVWQRVASTCAPANVPVC